MTPYYVVKEEDIAIIRDDGNMNCTDTAWKPSPDPNTMTAMHASTSPIDTSATSPNKIRSMPSSSLPKAGELSVEDDWTRVKDPKEKKRIQNRVAQRTYRHRMKARLGELQARLDCHEGRRQSSTGAIMNPPDGMYTAPTPERSNSISSMNGTVAGPFTSSSGPLAPSNACASGMEGMEESPSPMTLAGSNDKASHGQLTLMHPGLYDQPVDDSDPSLFPHARIMNSPPYSQSSPTQTHGLLSPPGIPGSEHGNSKMSQEYMVDSLRFQTQLLHRLNSLEQDPNFPGQYAPEQISAMMEQMRHNESAQGLAPFTSTQAEAVEFYEPGVESWNVKVQCGGPSPITPMHPGQMAAAMMEGVAAQEMKPAPAGQLPLPKHTPMEARIEAVMHAASDAGFENFDQLATAYYSDSFSESSRLANEQRLSRNRRLPGFIADMTAASSQWSDWERHGLDEEILKRAESMVVSEGSAARSSVMSKIGPVIESQDGMNGPATADALLAMKKSVQDELPNSWALTMALAADSKMSWQRDRSNTALATVLLLNFSGRIPNDQLLRLIGTCL